MQSSSDFIHSIDHEPRQLLQPRPSPYLHTTDSCHPSLLLPLPLSPLLLLLLTISTLLTTSSSTDHAGITASVQRQITCSAGRQSACSQGPNKNVKPKESKEQQTLRVDNRVLRTKGEGCLHALFPCHYIVCNVLFLALCFSFKLTLFAEPEERERERVLCLIGSE